MKYEVLMDYPGTIFFIGQILELEKTTDILASMGAIKKKQFLIGFALETENEIENARANFFMK